MSTSKKMSQHLEAKFIFQKITMLLKFKITILLMILIKTSLGSIIHDARDYFETESEKNSASSSETDYFLNARDYFATESREPVTLQASETSSTTSDCPLQEEKAETNAFEMRVHVLPRKVPFNVNMQLNVETRVSSHEKSISLSSKKLKIEVGKWSDFTVKAHKQGLPERWKVTVHRDGAMEGFQSNYFGIITYFKNLVVNIPSHDVSWYVGPKNSNCDALISTTKTDFTVESTTDGARASYELLEKKGIMTE